jgi:cell division protein ZapA
MSEELARVTVRILDKEYQVACPDEEREALHEIRESGKVVGLDRVAVMAALNLSHEILQNQAMADDADRDMLGRLRTLNDRLAGAASNPSLAH